MTAHLQLKKRYFTPTEVGKMAGVSRQTVVKWIERGDLEAELTPGGHHRIPASAVKTSDGDTPVTLVPVDLDQLER